MPRLSLFRTATRRVGFTLTEVIVVLVMMGVVGSAVFRILLKQQQAYRDSTKQAGLQREIRLTSSFLPSELRSTSSAGGDVIDMEEQFMTFLANTGSSVICENSGGSHFILPPLDAAGVTLTNWYAQPQNGDSVFVYDDLGTAGAEDDVWRRHRITGVSTSTSWCTGAPFAHPVQDAWKLRWRIGVTPGVSGTSGPGSVVRFSRPVRYGLYTVPSGKWYLGFQEHVFGNWTQREAIGGPFDQFQSGDVNPSGLQFRYFDSLGTRLSSAAQRHRVSRVDVYLRNNGGKAAVTERRPNEVKDSVMMRIALRNFK